MLCPPPPPLFTPCVWRLLLFHTFLRGASSLFHTLLRGASALVHTALPLVHTTHFCPPILFTQRLWHPQSTNTRAEHAPNLHPLPSLPLPSPATVNIDEGGGFRSGQTAGADIGNFMALMATQQQQMQAQYHRHKQAETQQLALGGAEWEGEEPATSTITEEQQSLLMTQFQQKAMIETGFLLLKEEAERMEREKEATLGE